jgi:hypothetical protein
VGRPGRFWPAAAARPVGWLGQRPSGCYRQGGQPTEKTTEEIV